MGPRLAVSMRRHINNKETPTSSECVIKLHLTVLHIQTILPATRKLVSEGVFAYNDSALMRLLTRRLNPEEPKPTYNTSRESWELR